MGGRCLVERRVVEIVPRARRTLSSLRNLGYDLRHAIADIVDNSVSAGATVVDVVVHFAGAGSWMRIADNGSGMDERELAEAFRYGSERAYGRAELGRFGFGLKTASTSQCRRVTVVSRDTSDASEIHACQLDVDHIEQVDRWEVFQLDPDTLPSPVQGVLADSSGTVVLWEDLDRVLHYQDPFGTWAKKQLMTSAEDIDEHLGMVFHRYLAGEVPGRETLRITVNGTPVEPWDPFCLSEPQTSILDEVDLPVNVGKSSGIIRLRPFILPSQEGFSSPKAWKRASGPKSWNRQQGFYIYRADRIIQAGGWSRLRAVEEHSKLARVSLEFFPELDSAFGVNVAKASVSLPHELRRDLAPLVSAWCSQANTAYRQKKRPPAQAVRRAISAPVRDESPSREVPNQRLSMPDQTVAVRPASKPRWQAERPALPISSPRHALELAATEAGEGPALARIVASLRSIAPEVARELGW
ncbi:ATP-binding protein [Streptomyces sp. NPDC055157]